MAGTQSRFGSIARSTTTTTTVAPRLARRLSTVLAALVGLVSLTVLGATAASAQVPPPDSAAAAEPVAAMAPAATSGIQLWTVVLVALVSVALGIVLAEGAHRFRQRSVATFADA